MIVTRKVAVCLAALTLLASGIKAQTREDKMVKTPNYALAERFSAKRVGQMVFSTTVKPEWFRNGNRFLYTWKTSEGTNYYIAEPASGTVKPVFDMEKLAMQITEIVKDPFEARHLPIRNLRIDPENDNVLKFDIQSSQEKKDTSKNAKTEKLTYHFKYDITSKKLTFNTKDEDAKYPEWANVSPDGLVGV